MIIEETGAKIKVSGNLCKRGEEFAINELRHPMRSICSTVKTIFPDIPVLPVRVSAEIPKEKIFDVMKEINKIVITKPVSIGDIIIENVLGLNSNIIATSNIKKSIQDCFRFI
jgi:CxxC motif-containing protein